MPSFVFLPTLVTASSSPVNMAATRKVFQPPELMGIIGEYLPKKDVCRLRAVDRNAQAVTW